MTHRSLRDDVHRIVGRRLYFRMEDTRYRRVAGGWIDWRYAPAPRSLEMDQGRGPNYNHFVDFDEAKRVLAAFEREGVRYVLIGSMAMAAHGLIRATRDIDFFVSPDPENVERLRRALKSVLDDDPNVDEITTEDLAGDYPAIECTPPHGRYSLDILSRLGEAFRFEGLESEVLVVDDVSIRVATPSQLYWMKKGTVRPQDRVDAQAIRERFGLGEEG